MFLFRLKVNTKLGKTSSGDVEENHTSPSVCSMLQLNNGAFESYDYCRTLIGNPTLEVEPLVSVASNRRGFAHRGEVCYLQLP